MWLNEILCREGCDSKNKDSYNISPVLGDLILLLLSTYNGDLLQKRQCNDIGPFYYLALTQENETVHISRVESVWNCRSNYLIGLSKHPNWRGHYINMLYSVLAYSSSLLLLNLFKKNLILIWQLVCYCILLSDAGYTMLFYQLAYPFTVHAPGVTQNNWTHSTQCIVMGNPIVKLWGICPVSSEFTS